MIKYIVNCLAGFHSKQTSTAFKVASLAAGAVLFLAVVPAVFTLLGFLLKNNMHINFNRTAELIISVISLIFGVFFLVWAAISQWKIGKGTPAPNAPTRQMVVSGPYKLCRNPIELGAVFYYLGFGTIAGGLFAGIICFLSGLILGSVYHKFIEEKELELRFGNEYRQYRNATPFLLPKIRCRR